MVPELGFAHIWVEWRRYVGPFFVNQGSSEFELRWGLAMDVGHLALVGSFHRNSTRL